MNPLGFSIIIPAKEISSYLLEAIPVTLALEYRDFEIIILPNDPPGKNLPDVLRHEKISIVPTGRVSPAAKRDLGAEKARYGYLAFLDDDAYPKSDWLLKAQALFREKKVAALGGPAMTPPNAALFEKASGLFFETYVGGGGFDYRYKPGKGPFYVDDFPSVNLIVERQAFLKVGGFDSQYWPGEDTKFCLDFVKAGFNILYSPELVVWHHRRSNIFAHLSQVGGYGRHRGHFARKFPETSARFIYFMPSGFLAGNLAFLLFSFVHVLFFQAWLFLLAFYFLIAALDVFSRTREVKLGLCTLMTIYLSHLTYGFRFLQGFFGRSEFKSRLL
ncbi:MAG: glycosyltransferase [Oligoflexales bacterium]|nr:glycosyltransferase [Oligoflexales bacterium]